MHEQPTDASSPTAEDSTSPAAKRRWQPPTLRIYGTMRDLTRTLPAGPNFDGGGGANIYTS